MSQFVLEKTFLQRCACTKWWVGKAQLAHWETLGNTVRTRHACQQQRRVNSPDVLTVSWSLPPAPW